MEIRHFQDGGPEVVTKNKNGGEMKSKPKVNHHFQDGRTEVATKNKMVDRKYVIFQAGANPYMSRVLGHIAVDDLGIA